jgi:hypothetical protein
MLDLRKAFDNERCGKKDFHAELYEKLFAPRIHDHIRMLEIGVWHGESLRVWKKFFDSLTLYGIDINSVADIDESIATIFIGDASWPKFMHNVAKAVKELDIVIDDGGHFSDDQQVAFEHLWPIVKKGGLYIVEDLWVAPDRVVGDCNLDTITYLEKVDCKKEWYKGFNDFEKDICVLYKE